MTEAEIHEIVLDYVKYQGFSSDDDPPKIFMTYWHEEEQTWEVFVNPGDMWDTLAPVWVKADGSLVPGQRFQP